MIEPVNTAVLRHGNPHDMKVEIQKVDEAELDEMGSFVGTKKAPLALARDRSSHRHGPRLCLWSPDRCSLSGVAASPGTVGYHALLHR